MRMAFGLAGLLITLGVMIFIFKEVEGPAISADVKAQKQADQEIQQIGGITDQHEDVMTTIGLFPEEGPNGKLSDFQVSDIKQDSPIAAYFGLKQNDVILSATQNAVEFKMSEEDSPDDAKSAIREAYTHQGQLKVLRGDATLVLPMAGGAPQHPVAQQQQPPNAQQGPTPPGGPSNEETPDERLKALSHMNPGIQ